MSDFGADSDSKERDGLSGGHGHKEGAPAKTFDEEDGGGGGEHEEDCYTAGENAGGEFGEVDGFVEDKR